MGGPRLRFCWLFSLIPYFLLLEAENTFWLAKGSPTSLNGIVWTYSSACLLCSAAFMPWNVSFCDTSGKHHFIPPSQERHKILLAVCRNVTSWLHWSEGIWDSEGEQRLIIHSDTSLHTCLRSVHLRQCMVKSQTSLRSSSEVQRVSLGHADNLLNSSEVMLIKGHLLNQ